MDDLKPEPPEGVKVTAEKDPLTGRMVRKASAAGDGSPAGSGGGA